MAKTKKKEKIVDLKPKAEKVTDKQLEKIQDVVTHINQTQMNIGQLEARKHQALHFLASYNDQLKEIQDELEKQYGTYDVSIQDGTINYPKENGEANKKD
jgi:hypothetical protein|tara:strand:- start:346 stop:645 length:300 start_codon:yes stop_codon:yes gene_type:complete